MIAPDERLGPYALGERLGEGGMGVVYRALDETGREVAIKLLRPELAQQESFRRRMAREVDTMRRIRSQYVAAVLDADIIGEQPYIVTQYVSGRPLDDVVHDAGPLAGQALSRVATGLAEAIAAIHEAGVVHRDLKPSNVMLLADGEPVVIDFGIAHATDTTRLTQTGMIVGTPGYLPPEVIDGQVPGPPLDVYAWAATVAYAATGRAPFGGGSLESVLARIIAGRPDLNGVPPRLEQVLRSALDRDTTRRPDAARLAALVPALDLSALHVDPAAVPAGPPTVMDPMAFAAGPPTTFDPPVNAPPIGWPAGGQPATPPPTATPPPPPYGPTPVPHGPTAPTQAPATRVALGWYKLLVFFGIVIAVCAASLVPTLGMAGVLVAVVYLRAGDSAVRSRRVPVRGAMDLLIAPLRMPGRIIRAMWLAVPALFYASAVAGFVVLGLMLYRVNNPEVEVGRVGQLGVAAFVYMTLAGPGIMGPRRQSVRLLSALARRARLSCAPGSSWRPPRRWPCWPLC